MKYPKWKVILEKEEVKKNNQNILKESIKIFLFRERMLLMQEDLPLVCALHSNF